MVKDITGQTIDGMPLSPWIKVRPAQHDLWGRGIASWWASFLLTVYFYRKLQNKTIIRKSMWILIWIHVPHPHSHTSSSSSTQSTNYYQYCPGTLEALRPPSTTSRVSPFREGVVSKECCPMSKYVCINIYRYITYRFITYIYIYT